MDSEGNAVGINVAVLTIVKGIMHAAQCAKRLPPASSWLLYHSD